MKEFKPSGLPFERNDRGDVYLATSQMTDFDITAHIAQLNEWPCYNDNGQLKLFFAVPEYQLNANDTLNLFDGSLAMRALCADLVVKHQLTRAYEPYDMLGFNWGTDDGALQQRTLEDENYDGQQSVTQEQIRMMRAVALAVLIAKQGAAAITPSESGMEA
ncbi:hypothetical protein [Aliagarivorans taiwanensis]|uniref:hypothetical protein n=1 Tax=Aliagarivorans taiwanensis TaxID=561966 RepID=UPI0003FFFF90|nr:hypothetical protein [Aliagarivorans taiwanensis]